MSDFFIGFVVGMITAFPWALVIIAVLSAEKGKKHE